MKTPRKIDHQWAVAIVAVCVIYLCFVHLPGRRSLAALKNEIEHKRNFVVQCRSLDVSISHAEKQLKQVRQYTEHWRSRVPSEAELPTLFAEIHRRAARAGVTITNFQPQVTDPLTTMQRVPITLAARGRFAELLALVGALENFDRPIWIEHLKFGQSGKASQDIDCQLKFVVFADNSAESG